MDEINIEDIGEMDVVDEVGEDDDKREEEEVQTVQPKSSNVGCSTNVIVKGVAPDTTPTVLKRLFPQAKHIELPSTKDGCSTGYAILIMSSVEEARKFLDEKKEYRIGEKVLQLYMLKTGPNNTNRGGRGFKQFGPKRGKPFNRGRGFQNRGNARGGRGGFRGHGKNVNPNPRFIEENFVDGNVGFDPMYDNNGPGSEHWNEENFNSFGDERYPDNLHYDDFNQPRYPEDMDLHGHSFQTDREYSPTAFRDDYVEEWQARDDDGFEERRNFHENPDRRGGRGKYRGRGDFRGRGKGNQVGRFQIDQPSKNWHNVNRSHDHYNESNYDDDFNRSHDVDLMDEDLPERYGRENRDRYYNDRHEIERLRTDRDYNDDSESYRIELNPNSDDFDARYRVDKDRYSETSRGRDRSWHDQYHVRSTNDQYDDNFYETDLINQKEYDELNRELLDRERTLHRDVDKNPESVENDRRWKTRNYHDKNQGRDDLYHAKRYTKGSSSSQRDKNSDTYRSRLSLEREEQVFDNEESLNRPDRSGRIRQKGKKSSHYERFPEDSWMEEAPAEKRSLSHDARRDHFRYDNVVNNRFENSRNSNHVSRPDEDLEIQDEYQISPRRRSRSPTVKPLPEFERCSKDGNGAISRRSFEQERRRPINPHESNVFQAPVLDLPRSPTPEGGVLLTRTVEGGLIVSRPEHSPLKSVHPVTPDRPIRAPALQAISPDQGGILVTRTLTGEIVVSNAAESNIANVLPLSPVVRETKDMMHTPDRGDQRASRSGRSVDSSQGVRSSKRQSYRESFDRSAGPRSFRGKRNTNTNGKNFKQGYYSSDKYKANEDELNAVQQETTLRCREPQNAQHSEYGFGKKRGEDDFLPNKRRNRDTSNSEYGDNHRDSRYRNRPLEYESIELRQTKSDAHSDKGRRSTYIDRDISRSPISDKESPKNSAERRGEHRNSYEYNRDRSDPRYSEHESGRYKEHDMDADVFHEKDRSHSHISGYESAKCTKEDWNDVSNFHNRKGFENQKDFGNYKRDRNYQQKQINHGQNLHRQSVGQMEPLDNRFSDYSPHNERSQHKTGQQQDNNTNRFIDHRSNLAKDLEPVDSGDSDGDLSNISRSVKPVSQKGRHNQKFLAAHKDLRITVRSDRSLKQSLENIDSDDSNVDRLSDVSADEIVGNELFTGFSTPRGIQPLSDRNTETPSRYNAEQRFSERPGKASYKASEALRNRPNFPTSYTDKKGFGTYSSISESHKTGQRSTIANRSETDLVRHTSQSAIAPKSFQAIAQNVDSNVADVRYFHVPNDADAKMFPMKNRMTSNINKGPSSEHHVQSLGTGPSVMNRMTSHVHTGPSSEHRVQKLNTGPADANRITSNVNMPRFIPNNSSRDPSTVNHLTSNVNTVLSTNYLTSDMNSVSTAIQMQSNVNTELLVTKHIQSSVNVMSPTVNPIRHSVNMSDRNILHQSPQNVALMQPPLSNISSMNSASIASVPFSPGRTNTGSQMRVINQPTSWSNSAKTDFENFNENKNLNKTTTADLLSNKDISLPSDVADVRKLLINQLQLLQQGVETDPTAIANIAEELKRLGQQKNIPQGHSTLQMSNTPTSSSWTGTGQHTASGSTRNPLTHGQSSHSIYTNIPSQVYPSPSLSSIQQEYSSVTQQSRTHLVLNKPSSQGLHGTPLAYNDTHPTYQTGQFTGVLGAVDSNNHRETSDSFQPQSTTPVYQTPARQSGGWRKY